MIKAVSGKTHLELTANVFYLIIAEGREVANFLFCNFCQEFSSGKEMAFLHVQTKAPNNAAGKLHPYQHPLDTEICLELEE